MSRSELEDFQAEQDLKMEKEYLDIQPLFKYLVAAQGAFSYLCQSCDVVEASASMTTLVLRDCWTRDTTMAKRLVPQVVIRCKEYEMVTLRDDE